MKKQRVSSSKPTQCGSDGDPALSAPAAAASPTPDPRQAFAANRIDMTVMLALTLATLLAFSPAFGAEFVGLDDPWYVTVNRYVLGGLSTENMAWAWTTYHQSNWHPLTWLSLQLDATLYPRGNGEVNPAGFHATNIFLHAANASLLYMALLALTDCRWRSATAAVLFALHPLRVESVAWVSERKDVLSIFFGLIALWAYARYVRDRSARRYVLMVVALALSLLSKAMLVTFPFLLLVLDWWPLERVKSRRDWRWLALEKVPLFALCVASCVITYHVQQVGGSVRGLESLTLPGRIANAVVSYATYLGMTVWPFRLAPYYPYQEHWPTWRVVVSGLILVGLTLFAVLQRRQRPFLLTGWLWFAGTLVPVIGLVQVGNQSFADRYTYFPSIGLCLAIAWAASHLIPSLTPVRGYAAAAAAGLILAAITWRQTALWKNDFVLWPYTLRITGPNAIIYNAYGTALERKSRSNLEEALENYRAAVATQPHYGTAHYNIARILLSKGRTEPAIEHLRQAIESDPHAVDAYNLLADELAKKGMYAEAEKLYRAALQYDPRSPAARSGLALLFERRGHLEEAQQQFQVAIQYDPMNPALRAEFGLLLGRMGKLRPALEHMRLAAAMQPLSPSAQRNCGVLLDKLGQHEEAVPFFRRALELDAKDTHARLRLATALARQGDKTAAATEYREATREDPDWRQRLLEQAWLRATIPDPRAGDAEDAVWAAETLCLSMDKPTAAELDVLAATYAEAGRFVDAARVAEQAIAVADPEKAKEIAGRLALYRDGRPVRVSPPPSRRAIGSTAQPPAQ
jgi:tetratricopeptide (TPR) repeat protein